jgi:urease accessory protein
LTRTIDTLLTALQFGDGQFPGGGFAFSWGLETLVVDSMLDRAAFSDFLSGQLRYRWASFDRVLIGAAFAAAEDLPRLLELDDLTDAFLTVDAARRGSRRAGGALLGTHLRLGTAGAAGLKAAVEAGQGYGHLPIVQGLVFAGLGLDEASALGIGAYTMAQALCTAAIRLGLIGHLDAQRALSRLRPEISDLVAGGRSDLDDISTFVPVADIAMMRHSGQSQRLFSN